jgi:hypothetical protein
MLDSDLAKMYGVTTTAFNQAVKRNSDRFPSDFMFQLTLEEARSLRSQSVILEEDSKQGRGRHSKYAPYVFTEHGIAMLSSVLRSKRAVQMNILIVRAFIHLRERHGAMIGVLASEIQQMKNLPATKRRFGFRAKSGD